MTGIKHDDEKPMMDLLPMAALTEVGKVLTEGSKKYASHNWRQGFKYSRLQAALLRHYTAFSEGEDRDTETNLLHLAHLTCCALFLLEHQLKGYGEDDRYTKPIPPKIKLDPKVAEEFWKDFKPNLYALEPDNTWGSKPFPKWKTGLNTGEGLSTHHMEFGLQGEKND